MRSGSIAPFTICFQALDNAAVESPLLVPCNLTNWLAIHFLYVDPLRIVGGIVFVCCSISLVETKARRVGYNDPIGWCENLRLQINKRVHTLGKCGGIWRWWWWRLHLQVLREAERERADVKRYSVTKAEKIKIGFIVTLSFAEYFTRRQAWPNDKSVCYNCTNRLRRICSR